MESARAVMLSIAWTRRAVGSVAPARARYSRVAKQVPAAAADDADRPSGDSAADVAIHRSRPTKSSRFRRSRSIGSFLHAVVTRASILLATGYIRIANQTPLSSITKSRHLTFFGHLVRTDEYADASRAIFEPRPGN